jgi:aspartate-semialdehyde dehydrogenase
MKKERGRMAYTRKWNVAVVGATGAVGQQMVRLLQSSAIPLANVVLLSSQRSAGVTVAFGDAELVVQEATPDQFTGIDIALFSAGGGVSKQLIPEAVQRGAVCIDNTSAYRMERDVPLVVPEVNAHRIADHRGIIANPNCSTIQLVVALKPIHDVLGVRSVVVSTYQAVSGAGARAVAETVRQTQAELEGQSVAPDVLPVASLPVKHPIAFNAIPQIDVFSSNGFTLEELKMVNETKKIMEEDIAVAATCVRVPVLNGHSESVRITCARPIDIDAVRTLLAQAPGVVVVDDVQNQRYPLARDASGSSDVFVGRIRRDLDDAHTMHMWIVSDNLLKGAAFNAMQIAEHLTKQEGARS